MSCLSVHGKLRYCTSEVLSGIDFEKIVHTGRSYSIQDAGHLLIWHIVSSNKFNLFRCTLIYIQKTKNMVLLFKAAYF